MIELEKKVLSIDGGGMKGIVSAIVLKHLEEKLKIYSGNENARIADYFDLIAGTSTGAILAALYLYPTEQGESKYTAQEILDLYLIHGKEIFKRNFLFPLFGAKYKNKPLKKLLDDYFGSTTIGELRKPCLLASYDTTKRSVVFFNTVSSRKDARRNYPITDAVLASTAAPTYFPPSCLKFKKQCYNCLIDGGVVANNPALCALIEALKLPKCDGICDIMLLSVGNVNNPKSYYYEEVKQWGLIQWARPILDILMDGSEQTVDYQLKRLYKSINHPQDYYRMQWVVETEIPGMDDVSNDAIEQFIGFGEKLAMREKYRIDEIARRLTKKL